MRIAILFDSFTLGGGAEKLVFELARTLRADIFTSGYKKELYKDWVGDASAFDVGNFSMKFSQRLGFLESALRFFFFRPKKVYDLYIFSGFFSIFAARHLKPNIWYCCQPNRTVYDLRSFRKQNSGIFGKLVLAVYLPIWEPFDQLIVKKHIGRIVCISKTIQKRIKKYYGIESSVIYPPIQTKKYRFKKFGDFFLSVGRLIPEKRVGLVATAFAKMPAKKLAIVGNGPLGGEIRGIAGKNKNIVFLGRVLEKRLLELYADCLATVYLPVEEDFGMVPLEGNAAGKPCIAAKEGGCLETVIDGKTGLLIEPTENGLIKAVRAFSREKAQKMRQNCISWAKRFDEKKFVDAWKDKVRGYQK